MRKQTLNNDTSASHPGNVRLSYQKLDQLHPELFSLWRWGGFLFRNGTEFGVSPYFWRLRIREQLQYGDSRAALVVSLQPLLIAAYTDELDCVTLLRFPQEFVSQYKLREKGRLLTINTYIDVRCGYAPDLMPGEREYRRYGNFAPYIAEFLSDDMQIIHNRKEEIDQDEWQRTEAMATTYRYLNGNRFRDGRPIFSHLPAV